MSGRSASSRKSVAAFLRNLPPVGTELVEHEGDEVEVPTLLGTVDHGRPARGSCLHFLFNRDPRRPRVEEAEPVGLLFDAVLEDLHLVGPEIAHRVALLVANHEVQHHDLGFRAKHLGPEVGGRVLRSRRHRHGQGEAEGDHRTATGPARLRSAHLSPFLPLP